MSIGSDRDIDPAIPAGPAHRPSDPGLPDLPGTDLATARGGPPAGWDAVATGDRRGGSAALARGVSLLQARAGNRAVQRMLGAATTDRSGPRPAQVRRGLADDQATASTGEAATPDVGGGAAELGGGAAELGGGAAVPAGSWTKVGPPKPTSYAVAGNLDAVAATINARAEAGSVTTQVADVDLSTADDVVTSARITVAETLELPTWTDKGTATTAEQQEWNRFSGALAAHENGHVAKDVAGFAGAHTAAKAARTVAKANAAVDAIETKVTQANADYDTATDHGRNAGTKLNTNLGQIIKVPPSGSSAPAPTDQGGGAT